MSIDSAPKKKAADIKQDNNTVKLKLDTKDKVEALIQKVKDSGIDITNSYANWCNLGFAFADEFGESGREYFSQVSQFHPDYNKVECDSQFDKCLNANGNGVSISTFFYLAKQNQLYFEVIEENPSFKNTIVNNLDQAHKLNTSELPTLPDTLFGKLPKLLQCLVQHTELNHERDILLIGSLVTLSACLPTISSVYGGQKVFANLFCFITAKASAGKGALNNCKYLVSEIHKQLREASSKAKVQFDIDLAEYNKAKKNNPTLEKPKDPPSKMLFIPANNSSTGAYQILSDSDGKGIIFETEGDTLAQAFKTEHGNYSDGFRKAFHHETISYYRRTDREYVEIESPRLSCMLSGTPRQVGALIPDAENGLFSRFIFYHMVAPSVWKNVFDNNKGNTVEDVFKAQGVEFYELYKSLLRYGEIGFELSLKQQNRFNECLESLQNRFLVSQSDDFIGAVRRHGLIAFRICMILSALRILETGEVGEVLHCSDVDFDAALKIMEVLIEHANHVFNQLPKQSKFTKPLKIIDKFFNALPITFNHKEYKLCAEKLDINAKTAEGYIAKLKTQNKLFSEKHNCYTKAPPA